MPPAESPPIYLGESEIRVARGLSMRIAVDAMGGDHAPQVNVDGAIAAAREFGITTLLVGKSAELTRLLQDSGYTGADIEILDAAEVVEMDEHPVAALRKKRNSSIRVAANCVRD